MRSSVYVAAIYKMYNVKMKYLPLAVGDKSILKYA